MRFEVWQAILAFDYRYLLYDKVTGGWSYNSIAHSKNLNTLTSVMNDGIVTDYIQLIKLNRVYLHDIENIEEFYEHYCTRN